MTCLVISRAPALAGGLLLTVLGWTFPLGSGRAAPALPTIPSGVYYITNYGAVGDGVVTNTAAIQSALDAVSAAGGGTVIVPAPGTFLSGPLAMHSKTRFQIAAGATLKVLPYGDGAMSRVALRKP